MGNDNIIILYIIYILPPYAYPPMNEVLSVLGESRSFYIQIGEKMTDKIKPILYKIKVVDTINSYVTKILTFITDSNGEKRD